MSVSSWLQQWYWNECNGDWEHSFGIHINTLDNPGWSVKIDLHNTNLVDDQFVPVSIERTKQNWVTCEVMDKQFVAYGGPGNLLELFEIFRDWASKNEYLPTMPYAITVGNEVAIRELVEHDPVNLEVTNEYGWTPLALAVETGDETIVELLINLGADVNGQQNPENAITYAIDMKGNLRPSKWTSLHLAVWKGVSMVELLVRHGANVNSYDNTNKTPLHWAASYKPDTAVISSLLRHGSDTTLQDADGNTPAQLARKFGFDKIAQLIDEESV